MKQERKEELIVRWMDGETFSAAEQREVDQLLTAEPELAGMKEGHARLRTELQAAFTPSQDVPYGDFFQTKLEQAIRDSEADRRPVEKSLRASWRESLRWWLAPVALGAMAVAFLAGIRVGHQPTAREIVTTEIRPEPVIYIPEGGVTANVVKSDAAGTSVIVLDGLQPIPDSIDLLAGEQTVHESGDPVRLVSHRQTQTRQLY
ncbi:anti-sigma factor family protein [Roseibacillus ishigakijimensis]|uniref:Anti-sigma factor n=1 Tax=Roseibacillus ishigakijimensis TaxID=454146 RepID=A0A934VMG3_9BACT|nr:anti-sigma factor [Roseibacillus ishigakijimensis]MBK1834061.1 anti-sigma factor [Roseibacillus ishigakijimensis]